MTKLPYMTPFERHVHDAAATAASKEPKPPKYQRWKGTSPSASEPSPLLLWWEREDKLRRKGELNEHAVCEIQAALKGVKNRWNQFMEKHSSMLAAISTSYFFDAPKALVLWNEFKLLVGKIPE